MVSVKKARYSLHWRCAHDQLENVMGHVIRVDRNWVTRLTIEVKHLLDYRCRKDGLRGIICNMTYYLTKSVTTQAKQISLDCN